MSHSVVEILDTRHFSAAEESLRIDWYSARPGGARAEIPKDVEDRIEVRCRLGKHCSESSIAEMPGRSTDCSVACEGATQAAPLLGSDKPHSEGNRLERLHQQPMQST